MRRREDGYHDLASLFHVIDLGDSMAFDELAAGAPTDLLTCNMEGVPTDSSNLVIKVGTLIVGAGCCGWVCWVMLRASGLGAGFCIFWGPAGFGTCCCWVGFE